MKDSEILRFFNNTNNNYKKIIEKLDNIIEGLDILPVSPKLTATFLIKNGSEADPENIVKAITGNFGKDGTAEKDIITYIRKNSHLYEMQPIIENDTVAFIEVSDENKTKYKNGTDRLLQNNLFMKLPHFWFCIKKNNNYNDDVTVTFTTDKNIVTDDFIEWEGNTFIGCYESSYDTDNKLESKSGKEPHLQQLSYFDAKQYARNNGNGFQAITIEAHNIMALLFYVYYGTTDCQTVCGKGSSSYNRTTGMCDTLGMTDTTPENSSDSVNFWGIENWWGGAIEVMDNIEVVDSHLCNVLKADGSIKRQIKITDNRNTYIKKLVFGKYGDIVPQEFSGDDGATQYFCDAAFTKPLTSECIAYRGDSRNRLPGGIATINFSIPNWAYVDVGASRLQYKGKYKIIK